MDAEHVLVIGATGGVGAALVARLAARGARLTLAARAAARLTALAARYDAVAEPLAARAPDALAAVVARATERAPLTGAVNLAGSVLLKPAYRTSVDEWREVMAQNLDTAFHLMRAAPPKMKGGSIVLVASAAATLGLANHAAIAAAKAGVIGLAISEAATWAPRGVRVNVVAPGLVETPLTAKITGSEAARSASIALHPLGRLGIPDDVASAIAFLLHPDNGWITGQVLGVDGGLASAKR